MENLIRTIIKSDAGIDFKAPEILLVTPVPIHSVNNPDLDQMLAGAEEKSRMLAHYYEEIAGKYEIHYLNPDGRIEINDTDGIHYTEKGHRQMADIIEEKIREIFPEN